MNQAESGVATSFSALRALTRGERALSWWVRLSDPVHGDRESMARLRRVHASREALEVAAAMPLLVALGIPDRKHDDAGARNVLDLARVLAHVRRHDPAQRPMQAAGWKRFAGIRRESEAGDDRPRLTEARFRRLYDARDGEERVAAFAQLITLLGGEVNVTAVAEDFLRWNHPELGDRVREQWAFDYYNASVAAPPAPRIISVTPHGTMNENVE